MTYTFFYDLSINNLFYPSLASKNNKISTNFYSLSPYRIKVCDDKIKLWFEKECLLAWIISQNAVIVDKIRHENAFFYDFEMNLKGKK